MRFSDTHDVLAGSRDWPEEESLSVHCIVKLPQQSAGRITRIVHELSYNAHLLLQNQIFSSVGVMLSVNLLRVRAADVEPSKMLTLWTGMNLISSDDVGLCRKLLA